MPATQEDLENYLVEVEDFADKLEAYVNMTPEERTGSNPPTPPPPPPGY